MVQDLIDETHHSTYTTNTTLTFHRLYVVDIEQLVLNVVVTAGRSLLQVY